MVSPKTQTEREVNVFHVTEERLVEPTDLVKGVAAHERSGGARREHLTRLEVVGGSALAVGDPPWEATHVIRVACAVEARRVSRHAQLAGKHCDARVTGPPLRSTDRATQVLGTHPG